MKHSLTFLSALAVLSVACTRQPVAEQTQEPASTIVNADGTVTFNYRNDQAQEVQVDVQFAGRHDMERDSISGLWTVTLGPADPDMYPYCFVVDGVSIMDPKCQQWFPNEGFKNSLLDIPGTSTPLLHAIQDVPHGNVDYVTYYSNTLGCFNHAVVYTPPTYDADKAKSYPVFYLISGTTDTEEVYYKVGRINYILDNLIAKQQAKDMIVVMPYGNPAKIMPTPPDFMTAGDLFGRDLNNDLMPYIEHNYRTINDSDHRAIGGFSRGGNQALANGLTHLDKFSYLCSYSSFTSTTLPGVYDNAAETNAKIHLFWLGIGTDDFLYGTSRDYLEFLDSKGIRTVKEFTTGKFGHTWMNAKYFLGRTLPLLFNPDASAQAMLQGKPAPAATGDEEPFTPSVMARIFPKQVVSPEFTPDGVIFRIKADKAKDVKIEGEMLDEPQPLTLNADSVWEITLSNINPDIYCYNFIVDGTKVMDPTNMYLAPDNGFKRSIVMMPGNPYDYNNDSIAYSPVTYKVENLPNGETTHYAEYHQNQSAENLTTICLVAGKNDTFESWQTIGRAGVIADQLMAKGECKPCIIFMTEWNEATSNADIIIKADDYVDWQVRRTALIDALKK